MKKLTKIFTILSIRRLELAQNFFFSKIRNCEFYNDIFKKKYIHILKMFDLVPERIFKLSKKKIFYQQNKFSGFLIGQRTFTDQFDIKFKNFSVIYF
jgi:hypothetical protein